MPENDSNPNAKVVEAARPILEKASRRLTVDTEPAMLYRLEPHPLAEDIDDGEAA
jgi:hypothetical protein